MPEAPEIAIIEQYIKKRYIGNTLISYVFLKGKYFKKDPSLFKKFKNSIPIKLIEVVRRGKLIVLHFKSDENELCNEWWVTNHFGLHGIYRNENDKIVPNYDTENKQQFVRIEFEDNLGLDFFDTTGFGSSFNFFNNEIKYENYLNKLSIDIFNKDFTLSKFKENWEIVSNKKLTKTAICAILINQGYLCSGIGNYLKCEILYDAKIEPNKKMNEFSNEQIENLYKSIIKISKKILSNGGRTNHILKVYNKNKDEYDNEIKYNKTNDNKMTYWVPEVQK
jgi:formamidopyrimidine-DNA glycosylase